MVVEPASKQHEGSHDQTADRGAVKLIAVGEASGSPEIEQSRGDLNTVEASPHIAIQNALTNDWPNHLSTRLNVSRIG